MSGRRENSFKSMRDRRRFPRQEVIAYVREDKGNTNRFYFVRDLSESGAFLISPFKPPIGDLLNLEFSIRHLPEPLDIVARIIRHDDRGFAVTFESMSDEDRIRLRKYLSDNLKKRILSRFNPG